MIKISFIKLKRGIRNDTVRTVCLKNTVITARAAERNCDNTVAIAAPEIPIAGMTPNPHIKIGSRSRFSKAAAD
ncbi:hypothetical protein K030075H31_05070 [Blautia producta]